MSFKNLKAILIIAYLDLLSVSLVSSKINLGDVKAFMYENTVCSFKECCIKYEIPGDVDKLEMLLVKNVFGQHIAIDVVVNALKAHWDEDIKAEKALTLSFHGWPGGGKNYVANFIASSLYKKGLDSSYVHYFVGMRDFGSEASIVQHQNNIYSWIKGNITRCPRQLFIFDEVDKISPQILNTIKPLIDYRQGEQAIYIFISNIGEYAINEITNDLRIMGVKREDMKLEHFENIITQEAFLQNGGFYQSDTIRSGLIDHYVPFLPLELTHVKECILHEFKKRNVQTPKPEDVDYLLNGIEWGPYAKTGCKRIPQKIAAFVMKHYKKLQVSS